MLGQLILAPWHRNRRWGDENVLWYRLSFLIHPPANDMVFFDTLSFTQEVSKLRSFIAINDSFGLDVPDFVRYLPNSLINLHGTLRYPKPQPTNEWFWFKNDKTLKVWNADFFFRSWMEKRIAFMLAFGSPIAAISSDSATILQDHLATACRTLVM